MNTYQDISVISDNAYQLAEIINGGHYNNILYYEFHEIVDKTSLFNWENELEIFSNRSIDYYKIFLSYYNADDEPAIIHVALKLGDEWFVAHDCGSNFYNGYGPTGILKLREACANNNILGNVSDESFDNWIKEKFRSNKNSVNSKKSKDQLQFEGIIKQVQYLTSEMQNKPQEYQGLKEESIRDKMMTPLNVVFKRKGSTEAKSVKGKTDILIKTKDGLNEHIFELKVWRGKKSLVETIKQLQGYLSWHNNYCGIIMFCYNDGFTSILNLAEDFLKEHYNFGKREKYTPNEFRFRLQHPTDKLKHIETHLTFINLKVK